MAALSSLFELPRYRPNRDGPDTADPEALGPGGGAHGEEGPGSTEGPERPRTVAGGAGGSADNLYPLRRARTGVPARPVNELPDVSEQWVSNRDPDLADRGDLMGDRAARYVRESNVLMINADFRLFTTIHDHFAAKLAGVAGAEAAITAALREVYAGVLVETVVGSLVLQGGQRWDPRQIDQALSEEALTAAVMPRTGPVAHIRRMLRGRFGAAVA